MTLRLLCQLKLNPKEAYNTTNVDDLDYLLDRDLNKLNMLNQQKLIDALFIKYCEKGYESFVVNLRERGVENSCEGLIASCKSSNAFLVTFLIKKMKSYGFYLSECLDVACGHGKLNIVELLIPLIGIGTKTIWRSGFKHACSGGHIDIVKLMIDHGANDWRYGLRSACMHGNLELGKLMIAKGADNFDLGLQSAVRYKRANMILLMVEHGAVAWPQGDQHISPTTLDEEIICAHSIDDILIAGCQYGNQALVELAIKKKACSWALGFIAACENNHLAIAEILIEYLDNLVDDKCMWAAYNQGYYHLLQKLYIKRRETYEELMQTICERGDIYYVHVVLERIPQLIDI